MSSGFRVMYDVDGYRNTEPSSRVRRVSVQLNTANRTTRVFHLLLLLLITTVGRNVTHLITACTIAASTLLKKHMENNGLYPLKFDFDRNQVERSCKFCAKRIGNTYVYDRLRAGKRRDKNRVLVNSMA